MKIVHGFGKRCHDLNTLFNNTNKISTFMTKLEKQSNVDPLRYDPNKYKGDGFEFFVEILLKSHSYDNRLGITRYEPVESDDNGVDGVGINIVSEKCVVQVKYRSNNKSVLTANTDHLSNMISDGMIKHKVVIAEDNTKCPRHYVITTANGLHHYTDNENFKGFVHCIGYDQLRAMLDNNFSFWNLCREISKEITESMINNKNNK
jgi:hypothetical protein